MVRAFFLVTVLLFASNRALAHGRIPATGFIAFHPTDSNNIVVRGTFGYAVTFDGGASWSWVCREAVDIGLNDDPRVIVTGNGSILAASFNGLIRGTDGACTWEYPSAQLETVVIDAVPHPTDFARAFAVTSAGGEPNRLFVTEDHGASWTSPSAEIAPVPYLAERIVVAPSNPSRIYVSGAIPPGEMPRVPFVYVSDDGGETFASRSFSLEEGDRNIYVLGVDPTNPDRVFMRVSNDPDVVAQERVVRSDNGGIDWTEVLAVSEVTDYAMSTDGTTVWIASLNDGLFRSIDGGQTFDRIDSALGFGCLALRGEELWACTDGFVDGFAVGRSTNGGDTFEEVMRFDDLQGPIDCAAPSNVTMTCTLPYNDLETDLGRSTMPDAGSVVVDAGADPGSDAGAAPPSGTCTTSGGTLDHGCLLVAVLLFIVIRGSGARERSRY